MNSEHNNSTNYGDPNGIGNYDVFVDRIIEKYSKYDKTCLCCNTLSEGLSFRCRDCSICSSAIQCIFCYDPEKHKGHSIEIRTSSNGYCDCGDRVRLKQEGFCDEHTMVDDNCVHMVFGEEIKKIKEVLISLIKCLPYERTIDAFNKLIKCGEAFRRLVSSAVAETNFMMTLVNEKYTIEDVDSLASSLVYDYNFVRHFSDICLSLAADVRGFDYFKNIRFAAFIYEGSSEVLLGSKHLLKISPKIDPCRDIVSFILDSIKIDDSELCTKYLNYLFDEFCEMEFQRDDHFTESDVQIERLICLLERPKISGKTLNLNLTKMFERLYELHKRCSTDERFHKQKIHEIRIFSKKGVFFRSLEAHALTVRVMLLSDPNHVRSSIKEAFPKKDDRIEFIQNMACVFFNVVVDRLSLTLLKGGLFFKVIAGNNVKYFNPSYIYNQALQVICGIADDKDLIIQTIFRITEIENMRSDEYACIPLCLLYLIINALYRFEQCCESEAMVDQFNIQFLYKRTNVSDYECFRFYSRVAYAVQHGSRVDITLKDESARKWSAFCPFVCHTLTHHGINASLTDDFAGFRCDLIREDPKGLELLRYSNSSVLFALVHDAFAVRHSHRDAIIALCLTIIDFYHNNQEPTNDSYSANTVEELYLTTRSLDPKHFLHAKVSYRGYNAMSIADHLLDRRGFCNHFIKSFGLANEIATVVKKVRPITVKGRSVLERIRTEMNSFLGGNAIVDEDDQSTESDDCNMCYICNDPMRSVLSYPCMVYTRDTIEFTDYSMKYIAIRNCVHGVHSKCMRSNSCSVCRRHRNDHIDLGIDSETWVSNERIFRSLGAFMNSFVCHIHQFYNILFMLGQNLDSDEALLVKILCSSFLAYAKSSCIPEEVDIPSCPSRRYTDLFNFLIYVMIKASESDDLDNLLLVHAKSHHSAVKDPFFFISCVEILRHYGCKGNEEMLTVDSIKNVYSIEKTTDSYQRKNLVELPDDFFVLYKRLRKEDVLTKFSDNLCGIDLVTGERCEVTTYWRPVLIMTGRLASTVSYLIPLKREGFPITNALPSDIRIKSRFQIYKDSYGTTNTGLINADRPVMLDRDNYEKLKNEYYTHRFI